MLLRRDQWCASVESNMRLAGDERVILESLILRRVRGDEYFAGSGECMGAEGQGAMRLCDVQADARLEPLPVRIDQTDQRDRRAADRRGQPGQIVEGGFRRGIENLVALECSEPCDFIDR